MKNQADISILARAPLREDEILRQRKEALDSMEALKTASDIEDPPYFPHYDAYIGATSPLQHLL